MTKLELIEFENKEVFTTAISKVIEGAEVSRDYIDGEGNKKSKIIIKNHRLYIGNNLSLNIVEAENKKVYVSVDYFSAQDRIEIAKNKKEVKL